MSERREKKNDIRERVLVLYGVCNLLQQHHLLSSEGVGIGNIELFNAKKKWRVAISTGIGRNVQ